MKTLSLLIAAIVGLAALTPVTASAGGGGYCRPGSTRVSYDRCGRQIISVYTFVGHSRDGCPIFRWIVQPCYERPVYRGDDCRRGGGYGRGYDRGGYGRGGDRCDGPRGGGYGFSIRIGR